MKILHIVQYLQPGGIEQFVLTLLKADFDNTYILALESSAEQSIAAWPVLDNLKSHIVFADIQKIGKKETVRLIRETCKSLSITTLHSHYSAPLLYAYLGSLWMNNIVLVHTEHDVWHLGIKKHQLMEKILFAIKKDIHLVAVSRQVQNGLKAYFPKKKTTLIPNAIDTNLYKPGDKQTARLYFKLPAPAIIIGNAGRLCEIKGHQFLIEAMPHLPEKYHLAIAGGGPLHQHLLSRVQDLGLSHRVHMLGLVSNMDLFYQACDLFCLPSLAEGLPLTLLEAQSANLPSICSDVGSCAEGIDSESGLLVAPKDSQAIAKACLLVHEKKGKPREFILKNFSLETLREKYKELYLGGRNDTVD